MKKAIAILMVLFILVSASLFAESGDGGQPGAFLRIPLGARPAGLGYAYTGISDDINALYYNPGGLYQIKNVCLEGTYSHHEGISVLVLSSPHFLHQSMLFCISLELATPWQGGNPYAPRT